MNYFIGYHREYDSLDDFYGTDGYNRLEDYDGGYSFGFQGRNRYTSDKPSLPHACLIAGCSRRFKSQEQANAHVLSSRGAAHVKYCTQFDLQSSLTPEEQQEQLDKKDKEFAQIKKDQGTKKPMESTATSVLPWVEAVRLNRISELVERQAIQAEGSGLSRDSDTIKTLSYQRAMARKKKKRDE